MAASFCQDKWPAPTQSLSSTIEAFALLLLVVVSSLTLELWLPPMADNAEDDTGDYNAPLPTRRVLYHLIDVLCLTGSNYKTGNPE